MWNHIGHSYIIIDDLKEKKVETLNNEYLPK